MKVAANVFKAALKAAAAIEEVYMLLRKVRQQFA
jgi:hypothetical protein